MNINKARCNKQVIRPRVQNKDTMLLKCKSTPVKVDLRYTLISNSRKQIVNSTQRNGSEGREASLHAKRRCGCWLSTSLTVPLTSIIENIFIANIAKQ